MSNTVIKVENISKEYHLGAISHGTLHRDLQSWSAKLRGKEDPNSKIGSDGYSLREGSFKALDDVSFQVMQGDVLGIIGRNGAGKSTLLKVISQVTAPSSGTIKVKGRLASLLEVGTGFHPELTGRENIFLNGAILGMAKQEIRRKFDEIVDFAEIEKFIDTPVKRYSSGMYVRLAFAVAAHLETEILLVDEVLAVGDLNFQKKCMGKMSDVSQKEGRTVLFVSHNMASISSLCNRSILIDQGMISLDGKTSDVVLSYYTQGGSNFAHFEASNGEKEIGNSNAVLISASAKNSKSKIAHEIMINESFSVEMQFRIINNNRLKYLPQFHFDTVDGTHAFAAYHTDPVQLAAGDYKAICHVQENFLNDTGYMIGVGLASVGAGIELCFYKQSILSINIKDPVEGIQIRKSGYVGVIPGVVRPQFNWDLIHLGI
jgi:lipopolysaccharide transport system ATP-binding protein